MEQKNQRSYRSIVSSTVIFGGAQVMNVLVNLIRGKIVVQILGAAGIGIATLFHNTADLIKQYATLGLDVSAVRNITQAKDDAAPEVLAATIKIVRLLLLGSALIGMVSTLALSCYFASYLFRDAAYLPFIMLMSVAVLFNVLGSGEYAILQGMRKYKQIALCSVVPPLCGLMMGVPIYLLLGTSGIVPAMIVMAVVYFLALRFFARRNMRHLPPTPPVPLRTVMKQGKDIIQFGLIMTAASLLGVVATFAITAFINLVGSETDLGYYASANAITMQYVGMVFGAMAASYYPQLARLVSHDMAEAHQLVNHQTEIILLVVAPIAMLIVLTAPVLIVLLLSRDMLPIVPIVRFMGIAVLMRALCFPMDYIALAKGDKKFFFWVEGVWTNVKTFSLLALFYYYKGLDGLGYAVLVTGVVDVIVSIVLTRWRYGFRLSAPSLRLIAQTFLMVFLCFAASFIGDMLLSYSLMAVLTLLCCLHCYRQLDRRIDIRAALRKVKGKLTKK